jgi:hypothetical protein
MTVRSANRGNQKQLVAYAAVAYQAAGAAAGANPALGTVKLEADSQVSLDDV